MRAGLGVVNSSARKGRWPFSWAEKVTARVAVTFDAHRPLRGPLTDPALQLADRLYDWSMAMHRRRWPDAFPIAAGHSGTNPDPAQRDIGAEANVGPAGSAGLDVGDTASR